MMGHSFSSALMLMINFFFSSFPENVVARRTANVFNRSSHALFIDKEESQLPPLLPIWATKEEENRQQQAPPLRARANENNFFKRVKRIKHQQKQRVKQQQQQTVTAALRIPAEYEPISTVIMAYDPRYNDLTFSMIDSIEQAGSHAWLLVPERTNLQSLSFLNVRLITVNFDSVWTRDYGPIAGIMETATPGVSNTRVVVDPVYRLGHVRLLDEQVPCQTAQNFKVTVPCQSTSIVMDGGNLMFDGKGNLFTTTITYVWNQHLTRNQVDNELMNVFNVDKIHALDYAKDTETTAGSERAADGTGHLDMFVKILAPCVVLVAEAPQQGNIAYWGVLNQAATYFSTLSCEAVDGSTSFYKVHRIPGWEEQKRWYTYTNSLIVNDRVIVPSYDSAVDNDVARQVYNTAAPHLTVDFVHSEIAIRQGGAIHCLTRDIPRLARDINATRA